MKRTRVQSRLRGVLALAVVWAWFIAFGAAALYERGDIVMLLTLPVVALVVSYVVWVEVAREGVL